MISYRTYCPNLWHGLHISTEGYIKPCCFWPDKPNNSLHQHSLEEIYNNEDLQKARGEALSGIEPEYCKLCFDQERRGQGSTRKANIQMFRKLHKYEDLGLTCSVDPCFMDLRFSNICNLKCKTCWGGSSSTWAAACPDHTWQINTPKQREELKQIIMNAESPVEIYFAGGEPILMPETWEIVEDLLAKGRTDVHLRYNTNLTVLEVKGKNILDLWQRWIDAGGSIQLGVSIDAAEDAVEYIRENTKWSVLSKNYKDLVERFRGNSQMFIEITSVVSILSVYRIPKLFEFVESIGENSWSVRTHNFLCVPSFYNLQVLPDNLQKQVIQDLRKNTTSGRMKEYVDAVQSFFNQGTFTEEQKIAAARQFATDAGDLDKFNQINPELKDWWKYGCTV